ncbi:hypothetical protein AVEN_124287-1 [Araneus ventricosus]|uniref:Uncharacterized protein n=1 Tax=Araneus ventricosus TaxID=182803 RepID=A0A4Y2WKB4_ARAVE|nr:hypothetical protein AVEN_124287-1 [Araneus ventricosus]
MFGTLGLVADSSFRLAGQLGMPGDISWLFSCFQINLTVTQAPGNHTATQRLLARTDDRITSAWNLAGLFSAPHALTDEMVSPGHFCTAPRKGPMRGRS